MGLWDSFQTSFGKVAVRKNADNVYFQGVADAPADAISDLADVTVGPTAAPLAATATLCQRGCAVYALPTNTGNVRVGGSAVSFAAPGKGRLVQPGEEIWIAIDDASKLFAIADTPSQIVSVQVL